MASAKSRLDQHARAQRPPRERSRATTSATSEGDDDDPSSRLAEVLDRSVHYLLSRDAWTIADGIERSLCKRDAGRLA